jgi:hypothetical protein
MQKTLLKMVQNTLSLMDSDEINSIGDTIEGEQIAVCYSTIYDQIVTEYSLPGKTKTIRIGSTEDMMSIDEIQYDVRNAAGDPPKYATMTVISNQEFLDRQTNKDTTDSNTLSQRWPNTDITFGIHTNKAPRYVTLVEDRILVFDSLNTVVDTNLASLKSYVAGEVQDSLAINDTTEVALPGELLSLLETNATELAFDLYKQATPAKIVHLARKARVRQQRSKFKFRDQRRTGEDYGRKSPGTSRTRPTGVDSGSATPLPDYI